jgi:cephalosporin-C deacetylase
MLASRFVPSPHDLDPEALAAYLPERDEPEDFDAFWSRTLDAARADQASVSRVPVDTSLSLLDVEDVTFTGYAGTPVRAWLLMPRGATNLRCIVRFLGYGRGRGIPVQWVAWPAAGYAQLVMDTRGQGTDTPDLGDEHRTAGDGRHICRGLTHQDHYYYRRLMTDAALAVEVAAAHPRIDAGKLVVAGASQGGGLALAAGALTGRAAAALVDVPFLCHWSRALQIAMGGPYPDVVAFSADRRLEGKQVLRTLSYFDGVSFAARNRMPALFSVALRDQICPPSTVYAAYNHYAGQTAMEVYEFNDHEGGGDAHLAKQMRYLGQVLG